MRGEFTIADAKLLDKTVPKRRRSAWIVGYRRHLHAPIFGAVRAQNTRPQVDCAILDVEDVGVPIEERADRVGCESY